MKASEEFKVGKHSIGWIDSRFTNHFADTQFELHTTPTFQKLPRAMNDTTIESELKPGLCELGDILAFLENAPEECKDGWFNLFYTPAFVVYVYWSRHYAEWYVNAWRRGGRRWRDDFRVFSPATENSGAVSLSTLTLENLDARLKKVEKLFGADVLK